MDTATIQAAQAGRRDAQAQLLRSLQDTWFRMSLTLLGNMDDARDATQETALRFLHNLPRYAGQSHLRTWAIGIALNVIREYRRRRNPTPEVTAQRSDWSEPQHQAELAEQTSLLRNLLSQLPPRQREALLLRFFEDLSIGQTASAMNCAPGTVKALVHQALKILRQRLTTPHARGSVPPDSKRLTDQHE